MAADSSDVIQRLEERAKEAEDTIEVLKKHLQDLTDKAGSLLLLAIQGFLVCTCKLSLLFPTLQQMLDY